MARYESEITQFLRELKTARPEIAARQREGRAIWWDKQLDGEQQRGFRDARVPQQPYVYATKSE
ncbi:MAG TPA: DUF3460 family protein [Burkholderiaceae bacterium]|jgi:hypothetical protein|nr:DUF3460 family protein [Burkholderiaceae bacterium]HPE01059.1 DUF3460 family protein [Burkholderiaceae bacterium]HRZ02565.1 DUF3460 family protein [Burkholderiaceae bacterium]